MNDIRVDIQYHFGELSRVSSEGKVNNGWAKELNIVSWNGGVPKYDIRDWSPDHTRMSRGITLTEPEIKALKKLLDKFVED